jgi:hypothetical protein
MQAENGSLVSTTPAAAQTNAAAKELSPQQIAALDSLLAGSSVTDAAAAAGVVRSTVHDWLRNSFAFQAALNRGRRDLRQAVLHRLDRIANNATECIDKAIQGGDVKAAMEIVKRLDFFTSRHIGSDDAAELELDDNERRVQQEEKANRSAERAERLHDARTLRGMMRR